MLDKLPLEVVARIGQLGRWNSNTFSDLAEVSEIYSNMVLNLRPYAEHFNLRFDKSRSAKRTADIESSETIARHWFFPWKTSNPQVVRSIGSIVCCLNISDSGLTDEDVLTLGGVHTLTLHDCPGITDVSALGGVHTLTLHDCSGITDVSVL